jgi:hypothetical protein
MTDNKLLTELSHKEFHIIMNRTQFNSDLTGQDASDYDAFIDAKIQEFIKAHNDKVLTLINQDLVIQ